MILTILSLLSVIPFIFVIIISFTDEEALAMNGYRFIPENGACMLMNILSVQERTS